MQTIRLCTCHSQIIYSKPFTVSFHKHILKVRPHLKFKLIKMIQNKLGYSTLTIIPDL